AAAGELAGDAQSRSFSGSVHPEVDGRRRLVVGGDDAGYQRVRDACLAARPRDLPSKALEQDGLRRAVRDQVKRMHRIRLPDAVDASDSLLQAHRIPRQLQIDNGAAALMK